MSVVVRFPTSNMTRSQYDSVHDALEQSGNWPAPGCLFHICFGDEDNLRVSEVWESRERHSKKLSSIHRSAGHSANRSACDPECGSSR